MARSFGRTFLILSIISLVLLGGCNQNMFQFGSEKKPELSGTEIAEQKVDQGKAYIRSGDIEKALAELEAALKADPNSVEAYTTIGDIHRHNKQYAQAVVAYKAACNADHYAFRPHYNLGVTYQTLAGLAPTYENAKQFLKKAINTYLRATVIKPESFDAHLNLGSCYFQIGQFDMANEETNRALQIAPQNIKALNNLGIIAETQEDYDRAIDYYKTSIERDPNQMNILLNLASLYTRTGRYNAAKSSYIAARKLNDENPALWQQIGVFFFRTGHYEKAIQAFQYALHLDPGSPGAYRGLGVVCMTVYIKDKSRDDLLKKAIKAWDISLKLQPDQPQLKDLYSKYRKFSKEA